MTTPVQVKLVPYGDGAALVLDSDLLEQLNLEPNSAVNIVLGDGTLLLIATEESPSQEAFEAALERANQRYARALRRLAE